MKHIYALIAALMVGTASFAQLPDGSIAPDFTATDINGVEHNLYDLLDEGKKVIVDFSATWCGPCWSYHTSGVFEELYELYGPDGTDELRIFYIESDDSTTDADLNGTGTATQGDWVTGTSYPIIDNGGSIFDDYAGAYYPTIYTICPNRILTESGQVGVEEHHSIFSANDCAAATLANDPALLNYTGGTTACPGEPVNMSVDMMNLGVTNLQYATIDVMVGGNSVLSYDWSGDLETYGITNVNLGTATFDADTDFTIEITSADDNNANNSSSGSVALATDATSLIHIEIMVDNWPQEIGWSVTDDMGTVVEQVAEGSVGGSAGDIVEWWVSVPSTGCYTFTITDAYGDGISGAQWGSIDGYCTVKSYNDDIVYISTIYDYDGSYDYEAESAGMSVSSVNVGVEEQTLSDVTRVFPNPFADQTNLQFSTAEAGEASIVAYNLVGEQIINDNLGTLPAGEHNHILNFNGVSAGVYLVTLNAGGETTTMRVTLK
ncbi:MAG: T9SS type A sorting domain-containing protein [Bacteroidetes bacterium]|nr:T9SS type A sorting domain-containing protein [Bacteroidota bacterium]